MSIFLSFLFKSLMLVVKKKFLSLDIVHYTLLYLQLKSSREGTKVLDREVFSLALRGDGMHVLKLWTSSSKGMIANV